MVEAERQFDLVCRRCGIGDVQLHLEMNPQSLTPATVWLKCLQCFRKQAWEIPLSALAMSWRG